MDENARNSTFNPTKWGGREENVTGNHSEPDWIYHFEVAVEEASGSGQNLNIDQSKFIFSFEDAWGCVEQHSHVCHRWRCLHRSHSVHRWWRCSQIVPTACQFHPTCVAQLSHRQLRRLQKLQESKSKTSSCKILRWSNVKYWTCTEWKIQSRRQFLLAHCRSLLSHDNWKLINLIIIPV